MLIAAVTLLTHDDVSCSRCQRGYSSGRLQDEVRNGKRRDPGNQLHVLVPAKLLVRWTVSQCIGAGWAGLKWPSRCCDKHDIQGNLFLSGKIFHHGRSDMGITVSVGDLIGSEGANLRRIGLD